MSITIHELSESLKQRLFDSNSSLIAHFSSRQTITEPTDEVNIDIAGFDAEMDSLFVYKNSVSLSLKLDYNISDDNKKIISTHKGDWGKYNTETVFDFVVLKNVKDTSNIDGVNLVDGEMIEDFTITKDKLSRELYNRIYSLPDGGGTGAILIKNSEQDYDVRWTTNTVCNVIINTFDNKDVKNVSIQVKNVTSGTVETVPAIGSVNHVDLIPGNKYEISVGDKDGYKRPPAQMITPALGTINTIYFMYNTELTKCTIGLETEDGTSVKAQTIYVRKVNDGSTREIQTDGLVNVYTIDVLANTQYEIFVSGMDGYALPSSKVINTTLDAVSNVIIRYTKDEVFCDLEVTGVTISPSDFVTVQFTDLKTDESFNFKMERRLHVVHLKSNTSYEVKVLEEKPGFIKPANKYIRTGANKSSISVPMAYEMSSNLLNINVSTDDNKSVAGVDVIITDGADFNKKMTLGESGSITVQVMHKKTYTVTIGKLLGYDRPLSKSILIEGNSTTADFKFKRVNVYGFTLDLKNSDPSTSIEYIEDSMGFRPMKMTNSGVTYGDWLNTFIVDDVKPVAVVDGNRIGYLSLEEEGRLDNGEDIPLKADLMAEFKKKYYSINIAEDKLTFKISNYKIDNTYVCDAFISERDNKTECNFMYYGMYEASVSDSKLHSKSGRNVKQFDNISNFRTALANNGAGYSLETITKLNYVTLLTMLVSKCADIKSFTGKVEPETNKITSQTYTKFRLSLPNKTITEPVNIFYINNLFNSPRFIEGCYLNGLKEIRYRQSGPYVPETNFSLLSMNYVHIEDNLYANHVKELCTSGNMVFPMYDAKPNEATNSTYLGSTLYATPEENVNKHLVLNNQADEGGASEPGYYNYCFINNGLYGARLTYTDER